MKKILAIQSDNFNSINIDTDTTLALALEAQNRNFKIFWYEDKKLSIFNSSLFAKGHEIKINIHKKKIIKVIKKKKIDLSTADYVFIRQNPPFNMNYIYSTYYLDFINSKKVINTPSAIRNTSEKFYSIRFLNYMPPTIFTRDINEINKFQKKNKKIVLKPIDGYSGKNIKFLNSYNKKTINDYLKTYGHIMVQKFLPEVKNGDKRVFIINGKVMGAIRRIPSKGSNLANISQGGLAFKTNLTTREKKISIRVAKELKKSKIFFAGIDLISNYLIGDINVTSPTGLPQFQNLTGKNLAKNFWDELENLK